MTLFCGITVDSQNNLTTRFVNLFHNKNSIILNVKKIKTENNYYKNVYINLDKSSELGQLSKISKSLDTTSTYMLDPHLSLTYGIIDQNLIDIKNLRLPSYEITLDQIALVTDSTDESHEAINSWKILNIQPLINLPDCIK